MIVIDNFPNAEEIRQIALSSDFVDWPGHDGEVYKRICIAEIPGLVEVIEQHLGPVEMLGMAYRLNFNGEKPNAAIHSDLGWGTHAAVLYLSDGDSGTAFWKHKETGASRIDVGDTELFEKVRHDWDDASKWEQTGIAKMVKGRCILYESAMFHSRWPFEAFGTDEQSGRLVGVAFMNLLEPK